MRGLAEGGSDIAIRYPVGRSDVAVELAAHLGRIGRPGLTTVGDGRKQIVLDRNQRRGIFGAVAAISEHERDGFSNVRDFAVGEREGPVAVERRTGIGMAQHAPLCQDRGEIIEGEHGVNAGQSACHAAVDFPDRGMRMRAAHEGAVQNAGDRNVIDEARVAGEQPAVLEAGNRRSNQRAHHALPGAWWARRIAILSSRGPLFRPPRAASRRDRKPIAPSFGREAD